MDNYQAIAYATVALKELGYDIEEIRKVKGRMHLLMDLNSEEEIEDKALKIYDK